MYLICYKRFQIRDKHKTYLYEKRTIQTVFGSAFIPYERGEGLLSQRFNTGYRDGDYSVPAGHLDGNETSTIAMMRESLEEIGIVLLAEDLKMVHVMHVLAPDRESLSTFFIAEKWQGEVINKEPEKCSDLSWFPLEAIPDNTVPYVRYALECVRNGVTYSEFGWE